MTKTLSAIAITTLFVTGFSGCGGATPAPVAKSNSQMPDWVFNPNQDGILGAVGSAKPHFKGTAAQIALAQDRGREEIAKQKSSSVVGESSSNQSSNSGMVRSQVENSSKVTTNQKVSTHQAAILKDPKSGEVFVWMREN